MLKAVDNSDKLVKEVNQEIVIWENYADDWLKTKDKGIKDKRAALKIFIENLLSFKIKNLSEINIFLIDIKNNRERFEGNLNKYFAHLTQKNKTLYKNNILSFLDWVSEAVGTESPFAQNEILDWFEHTGGINWKDWSHYLNEYNNLHVIKRWKDIKYLFKYMIFENAEFSDVYFFLNEKKGSTQIIKKELITILRSKTKLTIKTIWSYANSGEHFLNWLLEKYYSQLIESQESLKKRKLQEDNFIVNESGDNWISIQNLVNEWLCEQSKDISKDKGCFKRFFKNISQQGLNPDNFFEIFNNFKGYDYLFSLMDSAENLSKKFINGQCVIIINFCDWLILKKKLPLLKSEIINPYKKRNRSFLSEFESNTGDFFKDWINMAEKWISLDKNKMPIKKRVIKIFFSQYLITNKDLCSDINLYIRKIEEKKILIEDIYEVIFTKEHKHTVVSIRIINKIIEFIKFIGEYKNNLNIEIAFSRDYFRWLVLENGDIWNEWRNLANEWLSLSKDSLEYRKTALTLFFESFLLKNNDNKRLSELFKKPNIDINELVKYLKSESNANEKVIKRYVNYIVRFLDWIIATKLNGEVCNPFFYLSSVDKEPVHTYIKNLGKGWEFWSKYVEEWIKLQDYTSQVKSVPVIRKFIKYLNYETPFRYDVNALLNPEFCQSYVTRKKYKYFLTKNGVSEGRANSNIAIITNFINWVVLKNDIWRNPIAPIDKSKFFVDWFVVEYGNEWEQWCKFVDEWLKIKEIKIARSAIIYFMEKFLINHQYSNVDLFFNDLTKYEDYKNNLKIILDDKADNLSRIYHRYICELNSWIFHKYYSSLRYETLEPPFGRVTRVIRKDAENFEWFISTYGDEWSEWANLAYEWINSIDKGKDTRITSISNFFEYYLITFPSGSKVESFFCGLDGLNPSAEEFKEKVFNFLQTETKYITVYRHCVRFFDWILNKKFNVNGFNNFINPFGELKVLDGRSDDVKFSWLTEQYGVQWEQWRYLANEWILGFKGGLSQRMRALAIFLENYLAINNSEIYDVERFFNIDDAWNPTSVDLKKCIIKSTKISIESDIHQNINYIVEFIDWVLINHLCYENDFGYMVPMYQNPLERKNTFRNLNETVYSPLPYKYICNLRKKICPNEFGSFTDWEWAQNTTNKIYGGSWFDVDENIINFNDKDCVWRKVLYTKAGKKDHKYQLWSPVAAVALFVKLNLPLRTYQVRMLDSGEGDIERFENNLWNEPYRVCRRVNILRDYPDDKIKIYP